MPGSGVGDLAPADSTLKTGPRYYWGCCMVCRKVGSPTRPLKRCSGCNCMFYCSKSHQKSHWKQHKRLCEHLADVAKAVRAENFFGAEAEEEEEEVSDDDLEEDGEEDGTLRKNKTASWESWMKFRIRALNDASLFLITLRGEGDFEEWEKDVFFFPKACQACRLVKNDGMLDCGECMAVTYCSREHMDRDLERHRSTFCRELHCAMLCDNFESTVSIAMPPLPSFIEPAPLDTEEFARRDARSYLLAQSGFSKSSTVYTGEGKTGEGSVDGEEMEFRFLSDRLTGPLTIIHACLNRPNPKLANGRLITDCKALTVHLVGSSLEEMLGMIKWEYLTHRLPKLKYCRFVFVGPELKEQGETVEGECVSRGLDQCPSCEGLGRTLKYEIRRTAYEDYVEGGRFEGFYKVPDVVCAFNCGFYEWAGDAKKDTWRPALKYLVQHPNVPLIFTSYTQQEAERDVAAFRSALAGVPLHFDRTAVENPFRSHRPVRDLGHDNDRDVFYKNQFVTVVRRAAGKDSPAQRS